MLKDNEQQRAFIKLVCFTQVFTYLGVVIVSGILYMLLNMQLTADQLRFIFITYGWESIIALGIIIFFSIRWLNPIVKYANLLKTASEQNPLDVQKIYVKAVRFPLDISILSSLTVFSLFVMCFLQLGVFLNGNSQQILQGLILAIATSIGIGIVSILVNERLIAHYVAELYQKQLSNRISLPLQAKIITVSCFLVLLSIFFLASAQYKNYSSRIKDFVESRAFYELNILKAAYKAQQNTSEWTAE